MEMSFEKLAEEAPPISFVSGQIEVDINGYKYLVTDECYDEDKAYKVCSNQEVLYQEALTTATPI